MTTAQMVFLYAAEELNIGRAAKRAFISQQCASQHIKNLEQHYGVCLFDRKPRLSLTPAGRYLQHSLMQIWHIEQNTENGMEEILNGEVGHLSVSMNPTRCRVLMPQVLKTFSERYPGVDLSIQFGDTKENLELLHQGKTDIVIGVGAESADLSEFSVTHVSEDRIFFLAVPSVIRQYCPKFYDRLNEKGEIPLTELSVFPFCRNLEGSTMTRLIDTYLYQKKIHLNTRYNISDYDTQLDLCLTGMAAAFCPSMILSRVQNRGLNGSVCEKPQFFPIQEIRDRLNIDLIRNAAVFQPAYVSFFTESLKSAVGSLEQMK